MEIEPLTTNAALEILKPFEKGMRWDAEKKQFIIANFPHSRPGIYAQPESEWPIELRACWQLMPGRAHADAVNKNGQIFFGRDLPKALAKAGFEFEGRDELMAIDTTTKFTREDALAYLKRFEMRMKWDGKYFTIKGFPSIRDGNEAYAEDRFETVANACRALGAEEKFHYLFDNGTLQFFTDALPKALTQAGFNINGARHLPDAGVTV